VRGLRGPNLRLNGGEVMSPMLFLVFRLQGPSVATAWAFFLRHLGACAELMKRGGPDRLPDLKAKVISPVRFRI